MSSLRKRHARIHALRDPLREATIFIRSSRLPLTADVADQIIRTFTIVWNELFGGLKTATEEAIAEAPNLEEQLYDCSVEIAERIENDDPLQILRILEAYVAWESPEARKPFSIQYTHWRQIVEYK